MPKYYIEEHEVKEGDRITDFRGDVWFYHGCYTKPLPSTGRVVVSKNGEPTGLGRHEFYPSVFDGVIKED